MTTTADGVPRSVGVEMRVHGVGDHGDFSALGTPVFTGSSADRVRIGSLPAIPSHELKLINWSRRSRRITRSLSWYVAYPFTMVNMAGFMGPNRTDKVLWWFVRTAVVVTSVMMTVAMAMWITAIVETAWMLLDGPAGGVGGAAISLCGPGLLAAFVVNRMMRGRPLVDRGNAGVALLTLAVLLGTAGYLVQRVDSANGVLNLGDGLARDPMVGMVCVTTAVAWAFAIVLCCIAWRAERKRSIGNREPGADRTALAGAALLIAVAVVMLHALGSVVRLVMEMILEYTPPVIERRAHAARIVTEASSTDYVGHRLPIDLIPVFLLLVLTVLGMLVWRE